MNLLYYFFWWLTTSFGCLFVSCINVITELRILTRVYYLSSCLQLVRIVVCRQFDIINFVAWWGSMGGSLNEEITLIPPCPPFPLWKFC